MVPLFQESLRDEPFWMLVMCCLVNRTSGAQAKRAFEQLRAVYGTPDELVGADVSFVENALKPLGLWRLRAGRIVEMAKCWALREPRTRDDVLALPGCGRYAADSWSIFVERDYGVDPTDKRLREYLDAVRRSA